MGSDRARVSYDPSRKWRGLVAQQGRVTVEADWNEAACIDAERDRRGHARHRGARRHARRGYKVTAVPAAGEPAAPPGDLTVGPGTLYLGGERLDLDAAVDLASQPDWLDQAADPLWVAPAAPPARRRRSPASWSICWPSSRRCRPSRIRPWPTSRSGGRTPCSACASSSTSSAGRPSRGLRGGVGGGRELPGRPSACGSTRRRMRLGSTAALQVSFPSTRPRQPVRAGGDRRLPRAQRTSSSGCRSPASTRRRPHHRLGLRRRHLPVPGNLGAYDSGPQTTTLTLASRPWTATTTRCSARRSRCCATRARLTASRLHCRAAGARLDADRGLRHVHAHGDDRGPAAAGVRFRSPDTPAVPPGLAGDGGCAGRASLTALDGTGVTVTLTSARAFPPRRLLALRPPAERACAHLPGPHPRTAQPPDGPRMWACPLAFVTWDGRKPDGGELRPAVLRPRRADRRARRLLHPQRRPVRRRRRGGTADAPRKLRRGQRQRRPGTDHRLPAAGRVHPAGAARPRAGPRRHHPAGLRNGVVLRAPSQPGSQFAGADRDRGASAVTIRG